MSFLHVVRGLTPGQPFRLKSGETFVGRQADCDVMLPLETVSRRHARIVEEGGRFYIEDLNSTNGVLVNDERIEGRAPLEDQDLIGIDAVTLIFYQEDKPNQPKPGSNSEP